MDDSMYVQISCQNEIVACVRKTWDTNQRTPPSAYCAHVGAVPEMSDDLHFWCNLVLVTFPAESSLLKKPKYFAYFRQKRKCFIEKIARGEE